MRASLDWNVLIERFFSWGFEECTGGVDPLDCSERMEQYRTEQGSIELSYCHAAEDIRRGKDGNEG